MSRTEIDPNDDSFESTVLCVGVFAEPVHYTKARDRGLNLVIKQFKSGIGNWHTILEHAKRLSRTSGSKICLRLTADTFLRAVDDEHAKVFFELLSIAKRLDHVILVHNFLLDGDLMWLDGTDVKLYHVGLEQEFEVPSEISKRIGQYGLDRSILECHTRMRELIAYVRDSDLVILPYTSTNYLSSLVIDFLEGEICYDNTIRIFVPNALVIKDEAERFISLIRDYCKGLGLLDVQSSRVDTAKGAHFVFQVGAETNAVVRMEDIYSHFALFLSECMKSPAAAAKALAKAGVNPQKADAFAKKLSIDGKRLESDLTYFAETRHAELKRDLRESLIIGRSGESNESLSSPNLPIFEDKITFGTLNVLQNCTVQMGQILNVEEAESGLRRLITENSDSIEQVALLSDVEALTDSEIPTGEKLSSYTRIKRFVSRHSGKLEDLAIKALIQWAEKKLLGT